MTFLADVLVVETVGTNISLYGRYFIHEKLKLQAVFKNNNKQCHGKDKPSPTGITGKSH